MESMYENYLAHHGVKGQKWGVRRHKTIADRWRMHQMKKMQKEGIKSQKTINDLRMKQIRRGRALTSVGVRKMTNAQLKVSTPKYYADAYNKMTARVKSSNPELLDRRAKKEYKRSEKAVARYNKLLDKRKATLAKYGMSNNQQFQALAERTAGMKTAKRKKYQKAIPYDFAG